MPGPSVEPETRAARRRTVAVDHHVAGRIRQRRLMLGLSQARLAALVGVTYQQAQKYETVVNRISAGRLHRFAQALHVEVAYFYEGLGPDEIPAPSSSWQRATLDLACSFMAIRDRRQREAVCGLARALAGADPAG